MYNSDPLKLGKHNVAVDFETFATCDDAIAASIAAIPFNFIDGNRYHYQELLDKAFYMKFDTTKQRGRKTSKGTLKWWSGQSKEAQKQILPNPRIDQHLRELPEAFCEYMNSNDVHWDSIYIFEHGSIGFRILQNVFEQYDVEIPFNFWKCRCFRNLVHFVGEVPRGKFDVPKDYKYMKSYDGVITEHDPIHDCALDIMRTQYLIDELGLE